MKNYACPVHQLVPYTPSFEIKIKTGGALKDITRTVPTTNSFSMQRQGTGLGMISYRKVSSNLTSFRMSSMTTVWEESLSLLKILLDNLPSSSTGVSNWTHKLNMAPKELHIPSPERPCPKLLHLHKWGHHLPSGSSLTRCIMCRTQCKMKLKNLCLKNY